MISNGRGGGDGGAWLLLLLAIINGVRIVSKFWLSNVINIASSSVERKESVTSLFTFYCIIDMTYFTWYQLKHEPMDFN